MTPAAYGSNRVSPCEAITSGIERCALKIATSFTRSETFEAGAPFAQTRIMGSAERSMCFLSSRKSVAIDL